jgi:hypothetical protein
MNQAAPHEDMSDGKKHRSLECVVFGHWLDLLDLP